MITVSERKREAEGYLMNSATGSPIKRAHHSGGEMPEGASTTSLSAAELDTRAGPRAVPGEDFSIDEVRSRLHGQLDIQPISQPTTSSQIHHSRWYSNEPTPPPQAHTTTGGKGSSEGTGTGSEGAHSAEEDMPHHAHSHLRNSMPQNLSTIRHHPTNNSRIKQEHPSNGRGGSPHWINNNGDHPPHHRDPREPYPPHYRDRMPPSHPIPPSHSPHHQPQHPHSSMSRSASNKALLAAAQVASGLPLDGDPMNPVNALLAAAKVSVTTLL